MSERRSGIEPRGEPPIGPRMPGPAGHAHGRIQIERARNVRGTLRRLLNYLRPYAGPLLVVFLLVIVGSVLDLLGPWLMGLAIDRYIAARDVPGLVHIVLVLLGIYLVSWAAQAGQSLIAARTSQRAMHALRQELFAHMQRLPLSFFDKHPHGDLMSRLTNDMQAISMVLAQNVTALFSSLLSLVGIVVMMFAINFWLTLASMIVFPAMLWLVGFVGQRTREGFRQYQMYLGVLNGKLEEMFSGQRVILAFGRGDAVLADFEETNQITRDVGIRAQTYSLLVPPLMGIMSNANVAILAGLGGWMTLRGLATVGTIASFYTYSRRFAAPLRQLGDLYNQLQSALAGAERIFGLLDEKPELPDDPEAVELERVAGDVVFDHVNFSYVPGVPVIKDMSLHAKPGQTIALVGPTGAGKTTMINLLSRFYDVEGGAIRIDGIDIRQIRRDSLRRQLGVVLQDTFLFTGSVMDNIRYGRLDATDEEVIAAAKLANAHQFIERLPQGYATMLSERASNLSEGQRQLLAIARAILSNPGILILDEATSSVDTRTEVQIQTGLRRLMKGRTSFVIAHRLSTIRDADEVLVINEGEIIERGTHEVLLARQGFYYRLYMSQFKGQVQPVHMLS